MVYLPHDDDIDFPSPGGAQQLLSTWTSLRARPDFLDRQVDFPALAFGIGAHGFELHGQRLLIVGRHPCVDGARSFSGLAKTPSKVGRRKPRVWRGLRAGLRYGRKLKFMAESVKPKHHARSPYPFAAIPRGAV